jgi:hypothetical protein
MQTFTFTQEVAFDLAGHGNLKLTITNLTVDIGGGKSQDVQVSCRCLLKG